MHEAAGAAWANPSSTHAAGRAARQLLEAAREDVAAAMRAAPADIVLTGGGTEACNLGIRGLAGGRARVVTTQVEHPAVAESVHLFTDPKAFGMAPRRVTVSTSGVVPKIRPLLDGARGRPAVDIDALANTLSRFSALVCALRDSLKEIDVNPLIVGPDGCIAVDALVVRG